MGQGTSEPGAFGAPVIAPVAGGTRYVWSATGLAFAPGSSLTFTVTGGVGTVGAATAVTNTSWVEASAGCGTTRVQAAAGGFAVGAPVAAVTIVQTQSPASPASVTFGTAVTYRLVVTNAGSATLDALSVTDTVGPALEVASADGPGAFGAPVVTGGVAGGTRYVWSAAGLAITPGTSYTFTVTGSAGLTAAATTVTNTGAAVGTPACGPVAGSLSGAQSFTVAPGLGLAAALAVLAGPVVSVGQPFLVTLTVTNTGSAPVANVTAALWKDVGFGSATISAPTPAVVASLAPVGVVTFTFTLTGATPSAPGTLSWTATAAGGGPVSSNRPVGPPMTIQAAANLAAASSSIPASVCAFGDYLYV
ncbi:MAG: hypothetical protein AAB368_01485, partial [bacterium]